MAFKRLNTYTKRWEYIQPYMYESGAWEEVFHSESASWFRSSMFTKDFYPGKGTILQRDISNMPLDKNSDEYAVFMDTVSPLTQNGAFGAKTSLNTSGFGTHPIHAYIVDSTHPDATFKQWNGTSIGEDVITKPFVNTYMKGPVAQPIWAIPARNQDRGIAIYDVGTGIMREMFMAFEGVYNGPGGASINTPGLQNLRNDNYALQQTTGLSNVAGMHNSLGFIGISEAITGEINHALCFTTATFKSINDDLSPRVSWPARAADGKLEKMINGHPGRDTRYRAWNGVTKTPTHGQWGRVKADYDPTVNHKTGMKNPKFVQMVIRAAQKYGIVATDTNLWCHAFNAEQGIAWKNAYGSDPWEPHTGLIANIYRDPLTGSTDLGMDNFPWDQTEWAPIDWGRPSPDYNLRPHQANPWFRKE